MTAPELKPCPFCGGSASISKDHDPDGSGAFYAVKCHKCRAKSSEIYAVETCNIHFTQVRDAWNRRADLAAVQPAQPDPHDEVIARLVEALQANIVFSEKIAEAVDIDPEETHLNITVMPEGREIAARTWSDVILQGRAALAAAKAVQK